MDFLGIFRYIFAPLLKPPPQKSTPPSIFAKDFRTHPTPKKLYALFFQEVYQNLSTISYIHFYAMYQNHVTNQLKIFTVLFRIYICGAVLMIQTMFSERAHRDQLCSNINNPRMISFDMCSSHHGILTTMIIMNSSHE